MDHECSIATASPARPGQRAPAQSPALPRCRRPAGWAPGRGPPSWQCQCFGAPGSPVAVAVGEASIAAYRPGWEGTHVRREWLSQLMRHGRAQGWAWAKEPAAAAFLGNAHRDAAAGRIHPACLHTSVPVSLQLRSDDQLSMGGCGTVRAWPWAVPASMAIRRRHRLRKELTRAMGSERQAGVRCGCAGWRRYASRGGGDCEQCPPLVFLNLGTAGDSLGGGETSSHRRSTSRHDSPRSSDPEERWNAPLTCRRLTLRESSCPVVACSGAPHAACRKAELLAGVMAAVLRRAAAALTGARSGAGGVVSPTSRLATSTRKSLPGLVLASLGGATPPGAPP